MATKASRIALAGSNISSTGEVDADLLDNIDSAAFLSLDSNGRLGIGTNNPTVPLHIVSSSTTMARFVGSNVGNLYITNDSDNVMTLQASTSTALSFNTSGANERMRIEASGNVGIGTNDPKRPLQIGATGSFPISFNGNYPDIHMNTYYESGWRIHTAGFGAKTTFNGATGAFGFSNVASSQSAGATFTPLERLTILANGNVGIGTSSPSTLLHVDGNTTLDGQVTIQGDVTVNTNAKQFNFESDQERDNIYWSRNGVAHFFVIHALNGDLVFRNHASNNATGQVNFESTIQVGNTAITAANAGAGALKYDNVLQISNGTDWKAVRMIGQDGSSSANAFDDLSEVAGLHSSDTGLWTTVQGYQSGGLQYTVDFTTPFTPKYQASNSNSGVYSTSGTFGGCSQGTGAGFTVWDAAIYCMRAGARLCSLTELDANVVGGSGCSHDNRAIWTYTTDSNGHFYRGAGINSNSTNEGYVVGTNTSPTGYSTNEIGIRCCGTSASGGALWEI